MYNRYLQNDRGDYEPFEPDAPPPPPPPPPPDGDASHRFEASRLLGSLAERFRSLDTADLLLLALIFFLFEEKADDELLIALGLLLIL